jgi:hypothetical protein
MTKTTQNTDKTRKRKRSVFEPEKEKFPSPVGSNTSGRDFEVNKFDNLSHREVVKAQRLYAAISRSDSTRKIPEDIGFGGLMTKSYPWAPFPIKSLAGWRADKSTSGAMQPSESDWFISWWSLASQRPKTARESNETGSTGLTQEQIDRRLKQQLFLPFFAILVIKIGWGGKIPARRKIGRGQVENAKMEDAEVKDAEVEDTEMEDADEGSLSEFEMDSD